MTFCAWGAARADGTLANKCGLALSDDAGLTWRYADEAETHDFWPLDCAWQPWAVESFRRLNYTR
jgi:hypothetical protein